MSPWSRRGGALAVASLVLASACGRETPAASAPAAGTPAARASAPAEASDVAERTKRSKGGRVPVIWIGLDGFDFEIADRLGAEGRMPNWKRLESGGYTADLKSFVPILSPIVWTTLATGVAPDVHRILDFQEVEPATGQKIPISGHSRAVPAIWNVASASGLSVGVVGWWATHPAEEVKGFFVSDHASPILFDGVSRAGDAYPPSLSAGIEQVLAREGPVSDEELTRFVAMPASEIAKERAGAVGLSNRIVALARTIGATRAASRIARELYDRNLPDLTMLYFEGTDVVGHLFAADVPPRMSCVDDEEFARYSKTVDEYYALVDRLLGQWMRRAEEDGATLIVNSDHGFKWGKDRSCERGSLNPATAGFWHRLNGVFAAWGARVKTGLPRGSASVFDVEPTVAALLDLPVDRMATGKPIRAAFPGIAAPKAEDLAARIPVNRIEAAAMSEKEASEYAKKLVALGYLSGGEPARVAPSGGDRPGMTEGAWNNLGLYFYALGGAKNLATAADAYENAIRVRPEYASPKLNLAVLRRTRGEDAAAIDGLFAAIASGQPDPEGTILDWAVAYAVKKKAKESLEVLERGVRALPDSEIVARALSVDLYQAKDCGRADSVLARYEPATKSPETLNALALVRVCLGRKDDAVALFRRSLALQPGQDTVVRSLALLEGREPPRQGS
jgi:predicted AlkP superfamily phosphohydrolase/phosphomutase/tetratricopeptide (TPR) repeat protein